MQREKEERQRKKDKEKLAQKMKTQEALFKEKQKLIDEQKKKDDKMELAKIQHQQAQAKSDPQDMQLTQTTKYKHPEAILAALSRLESRVAVVESKTDTILQLTSIFWN